MNKIMLIAALITAALTGCRSVEVENYGQDYVRTADGDPILVDGKPVMYAKGWSVEHFQHWMITQADAINATVKQDEITFGLNGLNTQPDSEGLNKVVDTSVRWVAELAAKIGAAMATSGGSVGAEALCSYMDQFIARGGDPSKATVSADGDKLTISDGAVRTTCTAGSPP